MKNFVEELKWRGMIHDIMPGTEALLNKESIAGYIGFDPTASSLTIGNLVTVMMLVHFQQAGHKPIALVGGATGMIGDPSGKSEERKLLSEEVLKFNIESQKKQLEKFLDFSQGVNKAEIVNNFDWFKDFGFINFLRDVGKHLTVNYMLSKESVKKRLESGISFTEFSYQLLQGYDYLHLYKNKQCRLQMGGSDQWGNITSGTELIRRMDGGEAFALTCPLLTKADGTKFGKSEGNNVWLDPQLTSPYKFYQFWLNSSDEDSKKFIRIFTLFSKEQIEELEKAQETNPHLRPLQHALAKDITTRVHSAEDLHAAERASQILFGKSTKEELGTISGDTLLQVFKDVPQLTITLEDFKTFKTVTDFLFDESRKEIFTSKGEAKKMISSGAVSVNKTKLQSFDQSFDFDLLQDKYLLVQKGKTNYYLVIVE